MRDRTVKKATLGVVAYCPEGRRLRGIVDGGRHTQTQTQDLIKFY